MKKYRYLLIPGRHQALTKYQAKYLRDLLHSDDRVDAKAEVIWAVTSADHGGTRRNPIDGPRRLGMIEAFAITEKLPSQVYLVANKRQQPNFAHYLLEDIRLQSRGQVALTPGNCLVVCSTPAVIEQYQKLGFSIATAELDAITGKVIALRPWDVIEKIIASGVGWRSDKTAMSDLHPTCYEYYERYGLGDIIVEAFQDPLTDTDDGDITDTRDYTTYRQAFEDNAWRKVADFIDKVQPGRILDVGCATGETIKLLTSRPELFESDFYGVEVARPLYQICEQRKSNGEFGDANVFFYQRNIMRSSFFSPNSLSTIITMALTHEIESYLGHDALHSFLKRVYDMLQPGGVYINYDVVGPYGKDDEVYALLRDDDGANPVLFMSLPLRQS